MTPNLLAAAADQAAVLIVGGVLFGIPISIISWCLGYDRAMRKVGSWLRPGTYTRKPDADAAKLPPVRERRFIPTVGRP